MEDQTQDADPAFTQRHCPRLCSAIPSPRFPVSLILGSESSDNWQLGINPFQEKSCQRAGLQIHNNSNSRNE